MGLRAFSRMRSLVGAFAALPLFGLGYITADPSAALMRVELMFSGVGSAYHRSLGDEAPTRLPREAALLFKRHGKGPRADTALAYARTSSIAKQPAKIMAALAPLDVEITGSIDEPELEVNRRRKTASLKRAAPPAQLGLVPQDQSQSSAPLLLASLAGSTAYSFTRGALAGAGGHNLEAGAPARISRGLIFQGESEDEYQARQRRCLATAIYFEARGEPMRGQLAVAQVVMNRVRSPYYPDTICGVVFQGQWQRKGCQFSFACDGQADVPRDKELWAVSNTVATRVTEGKVWLGDIGYATHYHATYVKPRWRSDMNRIKRIGQHIFYRMPEPPVREAATTNPAPDLALARNG